MTVYEPRLFSFKARNDRIKAMSHGLGSGEPRDLVDSLKCSRLSTCAMAVVQAPAVSAKQRKLGFTEAEAG